MSAIRLQRIYISVSGNREELDKIDAVFQWLKINLGIEKTELYKKAFLWIVKDEKVRGKFIENSSKEKGSRITISY